MLVIFSVEVRFMAYKAIIFDVGDTLLEHYPSENQIYIDRVKHLRFKIGLII